jgi:hypothetical protein
MSASVRMRLELGRERAKAARSPKAELVENAR